MQKLGIIKNFTISINHYKLGFNYACYMGIYLDKASQYENVLIQLKKINNITGMDFTTGKFSLFCKIRAIDSNDARRVIAKIHKIEGVNRTETFISLEQLLNQKKVFFRASTWTDLISFFLKTHLISKINEIIIRLKIKKIVKILINNIKHFLY